MKAAMEGNCAKHLITAFDERFALGTVSRELSTMWLFGTRSEQSDDCSVATNAGDKLEALLEYPIIHPGEKEHDYALSSIEKNLWFY